MKQTAFSKTKKDINKDKNINLDKEDDFPYKHAIKIDYENNGFIKAMKQLKQK